MTALRYNPQTRKLEPSAVYDSLPAVNALVAHYDDALAEAERNLRFYATPNAALPINALRACLHTGADSAAEALRKGREEKP